jgi:hypothetical protein
MTRIAVDGMLAMAKAHLMMHPFPQVFFLCSSSNACVRVIFGIAASPFVAGLISLGVFSEDQTAGIDPAVGVSTLFLVVFTLHLAFARRL